jgi:hypothetical protein
MEEHEFTSRYEALGMPLPDPETMCKGQCDGAGCYPVKHSDDDVTGEELRRWEESHADPLAHGDLPCDGWHFITCPDCEGSGKATR